MNHLKLKYNIAQLAIDCAVVRTIAYGTGKLDLEFAQSKFNRYYGGHITIEILSYVMVTPYDLILRDVSENHPIAIEFDCIQLSN